MASTATINHPTLGKLTGVSTASCKATEFRGLRYAGLAHRFAKPEISVAVNGDCTSYGATPPQPPDAIKGEFGLIGHAVPSYDTAESAQRERISETECLNLNISVPATATPSSKLPVLVFIHGGNFALNAASWPHMSTTSIVAGASTPIVAVGINYRHNFAGYAYVPGAELPGNRGLHDQLAALQWLHAHVGGFGGDGENITIAGESAGSVSVELLLRWMKNTGADVGVRRGVMMSGTAKLLSPMPVEFHKGVFEQTCEKLGFKGSEAEKAKALAEVPLARLWESFVPIFAWPFLPLAVPELEETVFGVEAVMVGDTKDDGGVFTVMSPVFQSPRVGEIFSKHLIANCGDEAAALLQKYNLSERGLPAVRELINDVGFYWPNVELAQAQKEKGQKILTYELNEPNTWDCIWKGQTNHILDVAYLFGNYDEVLTEGQRKVAKEYRTAIADFAAGKQPWEGESKVFGGSGASERREGLKEAFASAGGLEKLIPACLGFLSVSPEQ